AGTHGSPTNADAMLPTPAPRRQSAARQSFRAPGQTPATSSAVGSVVPFDHAARFELTGRPGNLIQDVINISAEGIFVAVAIGYGLEEERGRPLKLLNIPAQVVPGTIKLNQIPASALIEGFRVDPVFNRLVFALEDPLVGRARGAVLDP